jgi:hypothetical protein
MRFKGPQAIMHRATLLVEAYLQLLDRATISEKISMSISKLSGISNI